MSDSDEVQALPGAAETGGDAEIDIRKAMKKALATRPGMDFNEEYEPNIEQYLHDLPQEVKRRILALKKLQVEVTHLEHKFFTEMQALEEQYLQLYLPLFEKRNAITSGAYEPTDEECKLNIRKDEALNADMEKLAIKTDSGDAAEVAGIPGFWFKIITNVEMLADMVEENDVPILKHLVDIKVETTTEPSGFKLHFHFTPNEWFNDTVLTKAYTMKCEVDEEDPFSFEGPEIVRCVGHQIDWKKGKNVTVKVIKKKQKHKQRGSVRTITKTVTAPSFFNFFTPPDFPDEEEELDEEVQIRITNDFEIGQYIRERIIPHAVLFYTGEALEDEDDDDDYDDGESEEESEGEEEEEEDEAPNTRAGNAQPKGQQRRKPGKNASQQQE